MFLPFLHVSKDWIFFRVFVYRFGSFRRIGMFNLYSIYNVPNDWKVYSSCQCFECPFRTNWNACLVFLVSFFNALSEQFWNALFLSPSFLQTELGRDAKRIKFTTSDLENLTGKYDTVLCIDVMIHYPTEKVSAVAAGAVAAGTA